MNCSQKKYYKHSSFIVSLPIFMFLLSGGCTAFNGPNNAEKAEASILDQNEKLEITGFIVRETHSGISAKLADLLPENPLTGLIGGAIGGFIGGFHPYALMIGGPILATPVGGFVMAACGAAVAHADDPEGNLEKFAAISDINKFRTALDTQLQSGIYQPGPVNPDSSAGAVINTVFEVQEITIILDGDAGSGFSCLPRLSAEARWRACNISDNRLLRTGTTVFSLPVATQNFREWFLDMPARQKDMDMLLEKTGGKVAEDLFSYTE